MRPSYLSVQVKVLGMFNSPSDKVQAINIRIRLRGYQLASGPHKRGPRVYGRLDDVSQKFAESQSSVATPDTDASGLEHHGFAKRA